MESQGSIRYHHALQDFRHARRRANMERIIARFRDRSADLLPYERVRKLLKAETGGISHLENIPLDAIVGSVGRYTDFTRSFLPKKDDGQWRWVHIMAAMDGSAGLPPIDVYQIGEVYFVLDGNHRVSAARQAGATHIQASVTQLHSRVSLEPDVQPDDLILKAEYTDFLEETGLDESRPGADLAVTNPGQYPVLNEHIAVHRYYMGLELQRDIPYGDAAAHWYDAVYMPVIDVIRRRGILNEFPGRTEADLYVWASRHREEIDEQLGMSVNTEIAVTHLAPESASVVTKIIDVVTPDSLGPGPQVGSWREDWIADRRTQLFHDILVPVSGAQVGWRALEQSIILARRDDSRIHGLHMIATENQREGAAAQAIKEEFHRRCIEANVQGDLAIATGRVPRKICERARLTDLVVLNLAYPPSSQPLVKLGSGFRTILRTCPRPVLAVPGKPTEMNRVLLAFDGSPKAREALFVAAYLGNRWHIPVIVVNVEESECTGDPILAQAKAYLEEHQVETRLIREQGRSGQAILRAAIDQQVNLILMGGYGHGPVVEVVLGSTVDYVLRESHLPILICH